MRITKETVKIVIGSTGDDNLLIIHVTTNDNGTPATIDEILRESGSCCPANAEDYERIAAALCSIREEAEGYLHRTDVCIDHGYYNHSDYKCPKCKEVEDRELELIAAEREEREEKLEQAKLAQANVHPALTAVEEDNDSPPDPDAETDLDDKRAI